MNKPLIILFSGMLFLFGCSPKTPEQLATQVCDCYKSAKSSKNVTKQLNTLGECYGLMQASLQELQQLGVDNDWPPQKVEEEREKFDNQLKKCDGYNNAE